MAFTGNAEYEPTTTEELRAFERGETNWLNASVVMKVVKKTLSNPKVGKRGEYRTLFATLCNDDECRVRLIAFSPGAEKLYERIEENALVFFTGLEVQEPFNKEEPIGPFNIEFKGRAQSEATILQHDFKVGRGMPLTPIQLIDFNKQYMRYKVSAELSSDFTPFMRGLAGQATLMDSTGRMSVQVCVLSASPGSDTAFRKGPKVTFKGTFRKISTITRLTVESDGDIDFSDVPKQSFFSGNAVTSSLVPSVVKKSAFEKTSPTSMPAVQSTCRAASVADYENEMRSTPSRAPVAQKSVTGRVMDDFSADDGVAWGFLEVGDDTYYEVNISGIPSNAETLLIKGALVTVHGSVDGFGMTVKGWRNVGVDGHDMFGDDEEEDDNKEEVLEASSALELRQAAEASVHRTFCEMNLEDTSSLSFASSDGRVAQATKKAADVDASRGSAAVPDIKPEPADNAAQFTKCNSSSGVVDAKTLKFQRSGQEAQKARDFLSAQINFSARADGSEFRQCDLVDLTQQGSASNANAKKTNAKGRKAETSSVIRQASTANAEGSKSTTSLPVAPKSRRVAGSSAIKKGDVGLPVDQPISTSIPPKRKANSSAAASAEDQPSVVPANAPGQDDFIANKDIVLTTPAPKKPRRQQKTAAKKSQVSKIVDQVLADADGMPSNIPKLPRRKPLLSVGIAANPERPKRGSAKLDSQPQDIVHIPNPYPAVPEAKHHFGDDSDEDQDVGVDGMDSSNSADFLPPFNEVSSSTGIADLEAVEDP